MTGAPITYICTEKGMVPLGRFHNRYLAEHTIGEMYRLEAFEERSWKSHAHYFACVHDAWLNLPEHYAQEFQSAEALRKYALIKTGWHDKEHFVLDSKEEAIRFASFHRRRDDFSLVDLNGCAVTIYTAKSQKTRGKGAMNKDDFQKSKQDVLDFLDDMIGVARGQTAANAGKAA